MRELKLTVEEVFDVMKLSTVVEVDQRNSFMDQEIVYYIRKRKQELNQNVANIFNLDIETVAQLSTEQFKRFM